MTQPKHTDRVVRLLNMLASDVEQERATVGATLARMAREEGKTVAEFVRSQLNFTAWVVGPPEPRNGGQTVTLDRAESRNLLSTLGLAVGMGNPDRLSAWERHFADDILRRDPSRVSIRQADIIQRIMRKLNNNPER